MIHKDPISWTIRNIVLNCLWKYNFILIYEASYGWFFGWFGVGEKAKPGRWLGLGLDSVLPKDTLFVLEEEIRILILYILLIFTFTISPIKWPIIGIICT